MKRAIFSLLGVLVLISNISAEKTERGKFVKNMTFTGNVRASKSERFVVPKSSSWQVQIKWMPKEGTIIKVGDPVVRFDTSTMANDIETLETSIRDKREMLQNKVIENRHSLLELDINRKKAEIEYNKAKLDAGVPKEIVSDYDYSQKQFQLKKSRIGFETALYEQKVKTESIKSDVKTLKIEIEEEKNKLDKKRGMLTSHTLTAKTSGPLVYSMHPWEGRKFQIGESVSVSWAVAEIPDKDSLKIEVWVNETEIHQIRKGCLVKLFPDAYPEKSFMGKVISVANSAEKRKEWGKIKRFEVTVEPENIDKSIMKSGMSVRCELIVSEKEDALLIPISMAYIKGQSAWVKSRHNGLIEIGEFISNYFYISPYDEKGLKEGVELVKPDTNDIREINNEK